jgi:Ser/Thr protein kinase RdoA (MazF antagonist)
LGPISKDMTTDPVPLPDRWGQQTAAPADVDELIAESRGILAMPPPLTEIERGGTVWKALGPAAGNNSLLAISHRGIDYVLKIYRSVHSYRVRREWGGLRLLHERGLHYVPKPCYMSEASGYMSETSAPSLLLMSHIPGDHLGERHLSPVQLSALAERIRDLRAITPETLDFPLWPSYADPARFVAALHAGLESLRALSTTPERAEARRLLTAWLNGPDPQILQSAPASLVFTRGDANLANCLWDGEQMRLLDFEGCGWRDPSIDLAFYVEHISSRRTPHEAWLSFVEGFHLADAERLLFRAAQRRMALSWLVRICAHPESIHSLSEEERLPLLLARAQQVCDD